MKTAAAILATLAFALAGCGADEESGEPIPSSEADAMLAQLELVEDRSDRGLCGSADRQVDELEQKAADLPRDVDADVRSALDDGLARLRDLVDEECSGNRPEDRTDTTPTETQPTETKPQPTETTPPPTETTPPPTDTTPVTPPGNDGGVAPPGQGGDG